MAKQNGKQPGKIKGLVAKLLGRQNGQSQEYLQTLAAQKQAVIKADAARSAEQAAHPAGQTPGDDLSGGPAATLSPGQVPQDDPDAANTVSVKGNALIQLFQKHRGMPLGEDADFPFHLSAFMEDNAFPTAEQRGWIAGLAPLAESRLAKTDDLDAAPLDAQVQVAVEAGDMVAWLFAFPAGYGGQELSAETMRKALAAAGITHGINDARLEAIAAKNEVFRFIKVAAGTPPQDGVDGDIHDHYKRQFEISLTVKDDSTIDYKDLGWLQTVKEGEVVCDIIPPVEATPGSTVKGKALPGKNGRPAKVPKGQGTQVNEEGTALTAKLDGVVSFVGGSFVVLPLLIIEGDVGGATGNLDVLGDVMIHGDIKEGFSVTATGNITVQGMIEGATVTAGANVQVARGMNGNTRGFLKAGGDVLSKFLENATVYAGGRIISDTIINSDIGASDAVLVKTGRGLLIGGSVTAQNLIEARTIGNEGGRNITITLGTNAETLEEKRDLTATRARLHRELEECAKGLEYLKTTQNQQTENGATTEDLRMRQSVHKMHLAKLERRLGILEQAGGDYTACRLRAEVIYPPASITIGRVSKNLRALAYSALVYLKDGDVHVAVV